MCTIRFGVSGEETISINFNASEATENLPTKEVLAAELQQQFDALTGFLEKLGL